jgi:putative ABC transport system permease protein
MFQNYLATALRNLARNRLYAAITILGLAVAFAAAILIGQFVRGEFSYDHWIPGYRQVYKITNELDQPGQPPSPGDTNQAVLPGQLKAVFSGMEAIARVNEAFPPIKHLAGDEPVVDPSFAWVDPDVFKVFPLPALAGDPSSALQQPDTVVITRSIARKYFHRDLPIGDTLLVQAAAPPPPGSDPRMPGKIDWRPMRVTAVLKDLPSNTNLTSEIFASGRSAYSILARLDAAPPNFGGVYGHIFVRLSPKTSAADLQRALDLATQPESAMIAKVSPGSKWLFHSMPLGDVHLTPPGQTEPVQKPTGSRSVAYAIASVGALIVLVAAINFVTLMTARAARRGVEVGVRKAAGARRADLMAQFIGEALIQVALAALIGMSLAELLLPAVGAFVQRGLSLDYLHDPWLLSSVACLVLCVGLLAAAYPALVLSSFRPAAVLKGGVVQATGSPLARSALVTVQFAILVGLIVTTATLYRQTQFALNRGLGTVDSRLIYNVFAPCSGAYPDEVRKLPGVAGVACSSVSALNTPDVQGVVKVQLGGGRTALFDWAPVDFGFFQLYGAKPLSGRLFQPDHGEDGVMADPNTAAQPTVIINETAAHALGFSDPHAAIGRQMNWARFRPASNPSQGSPPVAPSTIIGVAPDTPLTVRAAADPVFYYVIPKQGVLSIKLTGKDMPGTVRAIDAAWKRVGGGPLPREFFLSQNRLQSYLDLIIEEVAIAICAGLAILIACLGLFALSAYTTERRTKEIGVRKAMGARTGDVVLLLLWQFTLPVLAATAIAIPLSFLAMDWWLHGFAYRAPLSAWTFVLAAAAAVAIAWLTVSYQSFMVARAKPAGALRYE